MGYLPKVKQGFLPLLEIDTISSTAIRPDTPQPASRIIGYLLGTGATLPKKADINRQLTMSKNMVICKAPRCFWDKGATEKFCEDELIWLLPGKRKRRQRDKSYPRVHLFVKISASELTVMDRMRLLDRAANIRKIEFISK